MVYLVLLVSPLTHDFVGLIRLILQLEDASLNVDGLDPLKRGIKYCAKLGCNGSIKGVTVTMQCLDCNLKLCIEHIGKDATWRETIKKLYGPRNEVKRREIGFTCTECLLKKNEIGG